jgi:hypothetical protein
MDWLHAADQGVTADFVGNVFHYFLDQFPGTDDKERCNALFQDILQFYDEEDVPDRLDCLLPTFFTNRQGMKLRCSAAKCRRLVPFAFRLAEELADMSNPVEEAIHKAAFHLNEVYTSLSNELHEPQAMKEHSIKFASQYVALHDHLNGGDDRLWKIKPKLHFFLHLCSDGGRPSQHWCYRDEDFGGSVAKAARRRGGLLKPASTSRRVLESMRVGTPRVSIR